MDYIKTRMIALAPRYNRWMRESGARPAQCVHDELTWHAAPEVALDPAWQAQLHRTLEEQSIPFLVPFVWDAGFSTKNWAEAASDETQFSEGGQFLGGRLLSQVS